MSRKSVLFDLDGTLTDPALGITNSIMFALDRFGFEYESRQSLYKYIGPPLIESFERDYCHDAEVARKMLDTYRIYFSDKGLFENEVYEGIAEMLDALKQDGIKVYLATSKPEVYAEKILKHFDLYKYFDFVAGNTLNEGRPKKVDVINYLLESVPDIDRENAVMVGDRSYDVSGAHSAGIKCVGVLYGYGGRDELEKSGADFLVKDAYELKELLLKL